MGEAFQAGHDGKRQGAGGDHVQRTVLVVVVEDSAGGEQCRKQKPDPQDARRDAGEQVEIGAEPERRDDHDDEIEAEGHPDGAAFAPGELDVADEKREGRTHAARSKPRASSCANLVLSGTWLDTMAMPPAFRWSRITASSRVTEAASSDTDGSSRSQMGRGLANRRDRASFRFCPAERSPAGRSASGFSP